MANVSPILVPTLEELAGEFDRAQGAYHAAAALADANPANVTLDLAADVACTAWCEVAHQVAPLPAQNIEHVRLKARALDWLAFPQGEPTICGVAERLTYQLVRALLDGVPS